MNKLWNMIVHRLVSKFAPACLCLMLVIVPQLALSQEEERISAPQLIEDARQMLDLVESVHPQPYFNGGGKLAFHQRFQKILDSIPEEGLTREDFRGLLSPLLASIGEGHTFVYPDGPTDYSGIPLLFYVVEKELYVSAVLEEKHEELFGARLRSIEGVSLDEIIKRTQQYYGADNIYGTLAQLANFELFLSKDYVLEDLVPEWRNKNRISVSFLMPDGGMKKVKFKTYPREDWSLTRPDNGMELPPLDGKEFTWGFLTEDQSVAYLRVRAMVRNRETYEKRATYSDISEDARDYYHSLYEKEAPDAIEEVLAELPSLTETYTDLAVQMKDAGAQTLIVDLRTNVGGWALPADMLVYFLYGKEALIDLHRRTNIAARKLSPYYFESEPEETLVELNKSARKDGPRSFNFVENDFDLRDYERMNDGLLSSSYAKKIVEEDLALSKTFYAEYETGDHSNYYLPENVVVVTDVATFSAGFMFAKYMEMAGAAVVGSVPSQNVMQMGETVSFRLDNSKLGGNISHSLLVHDAALLNAEDPQNLLLPDYEMTYEKLKKHNFARHAAILYVLELLNEEDQD